MGYVFWFGVLFLIISCDAQNKPSVETTKRETAVVDDNTITMKEFNACTKAGKYMAIRNGRWVCEVIK